MSTATYDPETDVVIGPLVAQPIVRRVLVTGGDPDARFEVPTEATFGDQEFLPDARLDRIADALQVHHGLPSECRIAYRWKKKGGERNGVATLGTCQKLAGATKHFAQHDYLIWLAADHLTDQQFSAWEVEALLFHELLHVDLDEDTLAPRIRAHDCELFVAEYHHYGAWRIDLRRVRAAVEQMPLGLDT